MTKPVQEYYVKAEGKDMGPFKDRRSAKAKARSIAHGGRVAHVVRIQTQTLSRFIPQPRPDPIEIQEENN